MTASGLLSLFATLSLAGAPNFARDVMQVKMQSAVPTKTERIVAAKQQPHRILVHT
jgi:hypothetical protein